MVEHGAASQAEPDVSVVLPTYNEAGHIVDLLMSIAATLQQADLSYEIIVVDDDSPDGTWDLVMTRSRGDARVRCVRRTEDHGLGSAIGYGIGISSGASIAVLDADFNHDPGLIPSMLRMLRGADLVIGSRYVAGGGMPDRRRHLASYGFNLLVRALVLTRVHDNLSGYFVAPRPWLQSVIPDSVFYGYGDYFIRLISLARRDKLTIAETPVFYGIRPSGSSKTSFLGTPVSYLGAALRLTMRWDRPQSRKPDSRPMAAAQSTLDP